MQRICLALGLCALSTPTFATCYQGPLEDVFKEFSRDIAIQEALTPEQILLSQLDHEADPAPRAVEREVSRAELEWPLVPNQTMFERAGGSVRFEKIHTEDIGTGQIDTGQSVTLRGDNGYLMTLIFVQNPCWTLQAIKNENM